MDSEGAADFEDVYFAMMAELDFTKHLGGQRSTSKLLEMCHIDADVYVLDVGCGVGVTPCHVAREYGCRVIGVDLRPAMVRRARKRAEREGIEKQVEFEAADARDLPFDDGAFDVVICESVLAFLPERQQALDEFVRVARPDGWVGISESTWIKDPPPGLRAQVTQSFRGQLDVQTPEEWQGMLEKANLEDVTAYVKEITVGSETSGRLKRMGGLGGMARMMTRVPSLLIKRPIYRSFMRDVFSMPMELYSYWGYGLYVGRKAAR
jgi:ubiquinone/menaquinone biosynthesis C-methylase UbiE